MANHTVSILIRFKDGGRRRTVSAAYAGKARLKPGVGLVDGKERPCERGVYWLRWYNGSKQEWKRIGFDSHDAVIAQMRQEAILAGETVPEHAIQSIRRVILADAIESYLVEVRTRRGEKAHRRVKWLLELFSIVISKIYLDEINRDTLFLFMTYLKENGKSNKTMRDRIGSIETFLQRQGIPKLMKKGDLPKVTKKIVDCYTEDEVSRMLAVADEDELFLIQFLLATGVREQEAAHMTWDDVKIGSRSVRVTAKPDCRCPSCGADGFNIKDFEEREIPDLDDWFIDALKARKAIATRDLLFFNGNGNPQGHILYMLKSVGERAGIKCKNCVVRDGKLSCKRHAVNTHKFRRTFATWHHVLGGVSIAILQKWLGHSDVETTMRYIATTEIRPGLNRERAKLTWTGIAAKPRLVAVAS